MERKGEKIGWIGGWIGGFIWILILGIIWFFQDKLILGVAGIALFAIAFILIIILKPWGHPGTKFWKLMLPLYLVLLLAVFLALYVMEVFEFPSHFQYGLWIIPCFIPLFTMGNKTWK